MGMGMGAGWRQGQGQYSCAMEEAEGTVFIL